MHDVVATFNAAKINSKTVENEFQLLKQIIKIIERHNPEKSNDHYTFWRFDETLHALILDKARKEIQAPLYIVATRGHYLQIRRGFSNGDARLAALTRFDGYQLKIGEKNHVK